MGMNSFVKAMIFNGRIGIFKMVIKENIRVEPNLHFRKILVVDDELWVGSMPEEAGRLTNQAKLFADFFCHRGDGVTSAT